MTRGLKLSGLTPLTIGFMPLVDAALLVAACEEGFAADEGLDLALVREGSWAAIRDKLNVGLFDAAHMLAPAAIASMLGIGHLEVPLFAPVALNLDGNAITVSNGLAAELGLRLAAARSAGDVVTPALTAAAMAELAAARRAAGHEPLTIGVVFGFSCHLYQIRAWLELGAVDMERDVRFVVIPPPLMVESLKAGLIDLFCAGAPWNRMAEIAGAGHVLHPCAAIMPGCLEKLLVLRQERQSAPWLPGLLRAIARAATWAGAAENHRALARHLARPDYVGAPASVIEEVLAGTGRTLFMPPASTPSGQSWIALDLAATAPSADRLRRVFEMMRAAGHVGPEPALWRQASGLLHAELYAQALGAGAGGR